MRLPYASEIPPEQIKLLVQCIARCPKCHSCKWIDEDCPLCSAEQRRIDIIKESHRRIDEERKREAKRRKELEYNRKQLQKERLIAKKKPVAPLPYVHKPLVEIIHIPILKQCIVCGSHNVRSNTKYCSDICRYMDSRSYFEGGKKVFPIAKEEARSILKEKVEKRQRLMASNYDKYETGGAVHWTWYADEEHSYHKLVDDSLIPFIDEDLKGKTILDIGSGDGLVDSLLLARGAMILGIDSNETGAKIASEKLEEVHGIGIGSFVQRLSTIEDYVASEDFGEDFDYLYSLNTIEHVKDATAFIKAMSHVRNFGVIVTDRADKKIGRPHSVYHEKEYTLDELIALFADAGFDVKEFGLRHSSFIGVIVRPCKK